MEISSIGQRIKQRREELGLTQDELAQKLGYQSRSSINKIELGRQNLTQSKIKAFASALNVTPTYLMGWASNDEHDQALIFYQKYLQAPEQARQTIDYILKLQQPHSES